MAIFWGCSEAKNQRKKVTNKESYNTNKQLYELIEVRKAHAPDTGRVMSLCLSLTLERYLRAMKALGVTVQNIQTDRGSEYFSQEGDL